MSDLMEEDEEFAAAVHATFAEIDNSDSGRISFDTFVSWWRRKEAETGGSDPPDELLGDAWSLFEEFDLSEQGTGLEEPEALAEILVGLELEGFAADPNPAGTDNASLFQSGDNSGGDLASTLLDGLDDLDSDGEDRADEGKPAVHPGGNNGVGPVLYTRAELDLMKMSELRQLAKSSGVHDNELEQLLDSDEPKEALLAFMLRLLMQRTGQLGEREMPPSTLNLPEGIAGVPPAITANPSSTDLELDGEGMLLLAGLDDLDLSTSEEEGVDVAAEMADVNSSGDPTLTQSESINDDLTAELMEAFQLIDVHGSGLLGPDEFADLCNQLDPLMSEQTKARAVVTIDPDGKGIAFTAFKAWWVQYVSSLSSDDEEEESAQGAEFELRLIANVERQTPSKLDQQPNRTSPEQEVQAARKILRAWLMFKAAQEYAEKQQLLRAAQEAIEASAPDARAQMYGWRDADQLQQMQYAADLADSTNGAGAGLDWGPGNLPSSCPPATFFLPVPGERRGEMYRSFGEFAKTLVNTGELTLNSSDAYRILDIQNSVAHRTKRTVFREDVEDRQESRERFVMKLRSRYVEEQQNLLASRRMWRDVSSGRAANRLWRKARTVLVLVMLHRESRADDRDLSCGTVHSHSFSADGAEDLATALIEILSNLVHPHDTAAAIVTLAPPIELWESSTVNSSARRAFGSSMMNQEAEAAIALLTFYNAEIDPDPSERLDAKAAPDQDIHAASGLHALVAAAGATSNSTMRTIAKHVLQHAQSRQIAGDLLRCLNDSKCGGIVWTNAISVLSFIVEEPATRTAFSLSMGAVTNVDLVYSPADQRVLIDLLLRQAEHVPFRSMRLWRLWLHSVAWIVTCSASYGLKRHRRLDILSTIETLQSAGLHTLEIAQAEKVIEVVHSDLDEHNFQKMLSQPPRSLTRKRQDPAEVKVQEWLRRRGMNSVGIGYLATDHTKAVCQSFRDAGYVPEDWLDVLKSLGGQSELREYIAYVHSAYTPDGIKMSGAEASPGALLAAASSDTDRLPPMQSVPDGPPPDQDAIAALKIAAAADAKSKKRGDAASILETVLLYMRAAQMIEAACASERVSDNVRSILTTKQAAVSKRLASLRRKLAGAGVTAQAVDESFANPEYLGQLRQWVVSNL